MYGVICLVNVLATLAADLINNPNTPLEWWYIYVIGGCIFFLFVAIDWKWFKFYPLEADCFIDVSGRSRDDRQNFLQLQTYVKNHPEQKLSVYELFYRDKNMKQKRITFSEALSYREI